MTTLMTILGIVIFVFGLLFSIAWHELGHLSWAKIFKVRVPQYMVGFGPTIWSRKRGETEYGIKAIPLGGYIRMIGMFPPGADGKVVARSTSPWRSMIEDAREQSYEEILPGDETRLFYTRKPWQRVIIMFFGPFMNLILAVVLFLVVLMGFGVPQAQPTISYVTQCVVASNSSAATSDTCPKGAPESPAAKAGLKAGDTITSFDGVAITGYDQLQNEIRKHPDDQVTLGVKRGAQTFTVPVALTKNDLYGLDSNGNPTTQIVHAGFLGIQPIQPTTQLGLGASVDKMTGIAKQGVSSIVSLPSKIPGLWGAAFEGKKRSLDSPVGVVGVARVGGDVLAMHAPASARIATMLQLLAGLNLSLFLLNMLPLLPLDGGHIAGALWEALRRQFARLVKRPDPGPFDVAKLMPVAYVVAGIFLCFTVLVMIADVVNPVQLG
ncbi:M50 family metallopeptidase [Streptacidiphilus neutrinimicus]|uniref:M50 family metallopeptidase n=1 Tax=Streptacidiphilus neutrinimicus TaxID=105420 RepID=UPI0005A6326D|nr:site-2 protease family protein [Streptacidiphilus neutrinimicus]